MLHYFLLGIFSSRGEFKNVHTIHTYMHKQMHKHGTSHYAGSHYLKIHSERSGQIER